MRTETPVPRFLGNGKTNLNCQNRPFEEMSKPNRWLSMAGVDEGTGAVVDAYVPHALFPHACQSRPEVVYIEHVS